MTSLLKIIIAISIYKKAIWVNIINKEVFPIHRELILLHRNPILIIHNIPISIFLNSSSILVRNHISLIATLKHPKLIKRVPICLSCFFPNFLFIKNILKLWELIHSEDIVRSLGAQTGNQAVQQIQAGLKSIYVSGWQVAGDANNSGQTYPDQSFYPADSVPSLVKRINNALLRSDQILHSTGQNGVYWFAPIVADAEAGFGGVLWGSAGITIPWEVYQQYKDVTLLEEHYDAMKAYMNHLESSIDPESGLIGDVQLGDWLGPQNNQLGPAFLGSAYYVYDLWIMKKVAETLGRTTDVLAYSDKYLERKAFFNKTFINDDICIFIRVRTISIYLQFLFSRQITIYGIFHNLKKSTLSIVFFTFVKVWIVASIVYFSAFKTNPNILYFNPLSPKLKTPQSVI